MKITLQYVLMISGVNGLAIPPHHMASSWSGAICMRCRNEMKFFIGIDRCCLPKSSLKFSSTQNFQCLRSESTMQKKFIVGRYILERVLGFREGFWSVAFAIIIIIMNQQCRHVHASINSSNSSWFLARLSHARARYHRYFYFPRSWKRLLPFRCTTLSSCHFYDCFLPLNHHCLINRDSSRFYICWPLMSF